MEDVLTFRAAIYYVTGVYYPKLKEAPTAAFVAARKVLTPTFSTAPLPPAPSVVREKPYRMRSELSNQRLRLTKLRKRILKKTPLFFIDCYQETLIENPEYYGVCVVSSERSCNINPGQRLGWAVRKRAIERESASGTRSVSAVGNWHKGDSHCAFPFDFSGVT